MYTNKAMRLRAVRSRIFEYLRYNLRVTEAFLKHTDLRIHEDQVASALIHDLDMMFVHNKVKSTVNTVTYKHPETWFDMLLYKHAPSWVTKIIPVEFKVVSFKTEVNYYNMCHHLVSDAEYKHVHFLDTPFEPEELEDGPVSFSKTYQFT